jgi:hypothetical protein
MRMLPLPYAARDALAKVRFYLDHSQSISHTRSFLPQWQAPPGGEDRPPGKTLQ